MFTSCNSFCRTQTEIMILLKMRKVKHYSIVWGDSKQTVKNNNRQEIQNFLVNKL
jgi:hypothetical protein